MTRAIVAPGFSSITQWPELGTIPSSTFVAAARITTAIIGPNDFSPPTARTGRERGHREDTCVHK